MPCNKCEDYLIPPLKPREQIKVSRALWKLVTSHERYSRRLTIKDLNDGLVLVTNKAPADPTNYAPKIKGRDEVITVVFDNYEEARQYAVKNPKGFAKGNVARISTVPLKREERIFTRKLNEQQLTIFEFKRSDNATYFLETMAQYKGVMFKSMTYELGNKKKLLIEY